MALQDSFDSPLADAADLIAPDCQGENFYDLDPAFAALLAHYMAPDLHRHLQPHLRRLGELAGGKLDELARLADVHPPVLHARDNRGRDADWIEYHPAYKEMERIAFEEFGLNSLYHRGGVLDWPEPMGALAKYAIQYLFVQAEFGLMCPISVTDTSAVLIKRYAAPEIAARYLPRMTALKREEIWTGAQFMTERAGGSDVGGNQVSATRDGRDWRIHGDKWFCSHADGDIVLMLARTEGSPAGSKGLSLFLVPRHLEDGRRNGYRIVRLKDKLGTRSMASGEVRFEGAIAYLLGQEGNGLKHMMDQVNLSRLSHGVRAAAMMRRCLNEAMAVARNRNAFGATIIDFPLLRRQLLKIMLPTEQALSVYLFTAATMEKAEAGDADAERSLRLLTPLLKFRTARDNIRVATLAMEVRGGNGYIEEWVNARLVRDAHLGVLWEGTSNINALDVTGRAIPKAAGHDALAQALHALLESGTGLPGQFRGELAGLVDRAKETAAEIAGDALREAESRQAANLLYHATSAVLLAHDGLVMARDTGDARRLLLSRMVVEQHLSPSDPLNPRESRFARRAADLLLDEAPVSMAAAFEALSL